MQVGNRGQGAGRREKGTVGDFNADLGLGLASSGLRPHWWPPFSLRVEISDSLLGLCSSGDSMSSSPLAGQTPPSYSEQLTRAPGL